MSHSERNTPIRRDPKDNTKEAKTQNVTLRLQLQFPRSMVMVAFHHGAIQEDGSTSHKVKKFVKGLKPSLRARLLESDPRTLEEALSVASRQEIRVESYQEEPGNEKPECVHYVRTTGSESVQD
ncbi:hypothetical protein Taro_021084 [Colocasia esculenta]|uniref:Uncharacterized protein n=1 Tax=Colocasia esculenta TaxID=4460 RepID=A0A843UY03_COLES|nr:hypothetical protein [Colocasia esculenta]